MHAELAADHPLLHRPRQTSFVLLESAGNELLLLGQTLPFLLGSLLLDDVLDLAVEVIGFLLLFPLLRQQVLLFLLKLLEHVLVLALVACEVLGLALLYSECLLFLDAVALEQFGLDIYLGLRVLDARDLFLAVTLELL